jgi:hypothetical protein
MPVAAFSLGTLTFAGLIVVDLVHPGYGCVVYGLSDVETGIESAMIGVGEDDADLSLVLVHFLKSDLGIFFL